MVDGFFFWLLFSLVTGVISLLPNEKAFTSLRLSVNLDRPVARFGGMTSAPGNGAVSSRPNRVVTTLGRDRSVAYAGLSLKIESPFRSRPTVMLYG